MTSIPMSAGLKRTLTVSALCFSLFLPGMAEAKTKKVKDTIILVGGKSIKDVTVGSETFAEVKYRQGSSNKTMDGKKILEIIHGNAPRAYKAGDGQRKGGQYAKAINYYKKALSTPKIKPWVKVYANFYIGECYRLSDKGSEGVPFYKKAAAEKDHLLYPRALIGLAQALAAKRSWSEASSQLKKVTGGSYGIWRPRADYALGQILLAQGKMSDARRAFAAVKNNTDDRNMAVAGMVGEGQTYVAEKNYSRAIKFFRDILSKSDVPREVMAGAWAGIGDCEMAQASGDKKGERRALLAYLTVIVEFAGAPDAYPRALFQGAKLYEKFGLKDQAKALKRELKSRCPTSKYAKES